MNKLLKAAAMAVALAGVATFAVGGTANARVLGISLNLGDVAFGYQDGYWDHSHQWHNWRNQRDARSYRSAHGSEYHAWSHNRDADHGWHG